MQNQEVGGAKALLLLGAKESRHDESAFDSAPADPADSIQLLSSAKTTVDVDHTVLHNGLNTLGASLEGQDNLNLSHNLSQNLAKLSHNLSNNQNSPNQNSHSDRPGHEDVGSHRHNATATAHRVPADDEMFDKTTQQLNDAVEAAVMRYVGGTLATEEPDGNPTSLAKRERLQDDLINEYHWDRFLESDHVAEFDRTPRKRARKTYLGSNDIDPELADLDATTDHDLLVHAAIIGAGDLAKELLLPEGQEKLMFLDRMSVGADPGGGAGALSDLGYVHGPHSLNGSHSVNSTPAAALDHHALKPRHTLKPKRPLKALPEGLAHESAAQLKYKAQTIEELVKEAAHESYVWFSAQKNVGARGPRMFSLEEVAIVDSFIVAYCRLNNLTRTQICKRVWTMDKPKDNFWEYLTKVLPYRSRASVYKHVRRQYHVFAVRAKWTEEEDKQLHKLAELTTTCWKQIGEAMNRMPEDCRDRWRNYLKCGENRVMNKWSEEEENMLRRIIIEFLSATDRNSPGPINWTLVSEKMNGVRSRIQCRYKWNKLVRRELMERVKMMGSSTKIWLLNRLLDLNAPDESAVNWEYLSQSHHSENKDKGKPTWSGVDFQVAFEKLRSSVRDYKSLLFQTVISKLLGIVYLTPGPDEDQAQGELRSKGAVAPRAESAAEQEPASVANAAVAAVSFGVNGHDARHQEYSLWR